jgi:hypothetical protein
LIPLYGSGWRADADCWGAMNFLTNFAISTIDIKPSPLISYWS